MQILRLQISDAARSGGNMCVAASFHGARDTRRAFREKKKYVRGGNLEGCRSSRRSCNAEDNTIGAAGQRVTLAPFARRLYPATASNAPIA